MLNPDRLETLLAGCPLAREIRVFAETASTNDVAAHYGKSGAAEGVLIFAERQTKGRGRQGRKWESEPGATLAFSLLLHPKFPAAEWSRLTLCAALSLAETMEEFCGEPAQIKWPNDVYLRGKKAAGILVETGQGTEPFAVLGVGINVNQADFAAELAETAISLRQVAQRLLVRELFAARLVLKIAERYANLTSDFMEVLQETRARDFLFSRRIQVIEGGSVTLLATAEGFDESGGLRLRLDDGSLKILHSGEISVRPIY